MNSIDVNQDALEELRKMVKLPKYDTLFSYKSYFVPDYYAYICCRARGVWLCSSPYLDKSHIDLTMPKTYDDVLYLHKQVNAIERIIREKSGQIHHRESYFPSEDLDRVIDLLKQLYSLPMTKSALKC
tara:strand:- start:907 stop:1290 length:384 start_codon:yes stop_codon:yes gene_type:complete